MFQRGQKIVILESNSPKRTHPAVGDVGYLNNMYLFFKDRFILLDAFFLSYKSDTKKNIDRCERKRFIIDLGMKKRLKYKIWKEGVPKKFFVDNRYVANLTPAGHMLYNDTEYQESPNMNFMWLRTYNDRGKYLLNTHVKTPYGQIAILPNSKKPINKEGANALNCWIQCLIQLLTAEVEVFSSAHTGITTIHSIAAAKYYQRLHKLIPKLHRKDALATKHVDKIIEDMRVVQVMSKFLLDSCDRAAFKNTELRSQTTNMNILWATYGIDYAVEAVPYWIHKTITGIFFRSMLTPGDIGEALHRVRSAHFLPWNSEITSNKAKKLEKIKQEAYSNSAALARIFEEKLF